MTDYKYRARQNRKEYASEAADQFESTVLHNLVYETVGGEHDRDDVLIRTLDLIERAYSLSYETDNDGLDDAAFEAGEALTDTPDELVDDLVATALVRFLDQCDEWTDAWDQSEINEAAAEARTWLADRPDIAESAGVLEVSEA